MSTLVKQLRARAETQGPQPGLFGAVGSGWRQLSWAAWWASVRQTAGGLLDEGVQPGEPVLVWMPTCPEWAVLWPALLALGALPVLVDPDAEDPELLEALAGTDARRVATSGRSRVGRLFGLRESAALSLERVITTDRQEVQTPRLVDLDGLIERGVDRQDEVDRLLDDAPDSGRVALVGDRPITSEELVDPALVLPPAGRVAVGTTPACRLTLWAVDQAVRTGSELWLARGPDPLVRGLVDLEPDVLCLDEVGWRAVFELLDRAAEDTAGVRGPLLRWSRRPVEGPARSLALAVRGPLLRSVGLLETRCFAHPSPPAALVEQLDGLGVEVSRLPPGPLRAPRR